MIGLLVRSVFLIGIIIWYSTGVWRMINDYFREEFQNHLSNEIKRNQHIKPEPETTNVYSLPKSVVRDATVAVEKPGSASQTVTRGNDIHINHQNQIITTKDSTDNADRTKPIELNAGDGGGDNAAQIGDNNQADESVWINYWTTHRHSVRANDKHVCFTESSSTTATTDDCRRNIVPQNQWH